MPTVNVYLAVALSIITVTSIVAVTALLLRERRLQKKHLTATARASDAEKQALIMTTPGETPAGPPPMAWQADYGLIPQMGQPPPYMMGGMMGMPGMGMPGMMGGMWPGAMNADGGMGEPKPQYLPPGPMPYGGGMGMGGFDGGMMGYPGYGMGCCPP